MKQVQLKIEEFFDYEIKYEIKDAHKYSKIVGDINEIINKKCHKFNYGTLLKEDESRKTIIQSLWEYQKSLLPYELKNKNEEFYEGNKEYNDFIYVVDLDYRDMETFYNPTRRIITITDFGGD